MLNTQFLFRLDVELGPFQDIGQVPEGYRRVIPITGGEFVGEKLSGTIVPGGADWNVVRHDGVTHIWARYTLKTRDGTLIVITNEGLQSGPPDTMAKILAGEPFDKSDWYARTQAKFEVSDEKYRFLNERIFIGNLLPPENGPTNVSIEMYEVL